MAQKLYSTPLDACTAAGVEYPSRGLLPGPWNVSKAFDGKRWKQGAGRVRMFSDGNGGVVWNWITGEAALWFDDAGKTLTKAERDSLMRRAAMERRKWDEEQARRWEEVAAFASQLLKQAAPVVEHPYLDRKHVKAVSGLFVMDAVDIQREFERFYQGTPRRLMDCKTNRPMTGSVLMVPLYRSVHATVPSSIECISENGGKYALPEAQAKGAFWLPESVRLSNQSVGRIGIAEGIATALSISQVLGFPCVAARYCGNLSAVAQTLRNYFPDAHIEVCGDRGNGEEDARRAAEAVGGKLRIPSFSSVLIQKFKAITGGNQPTDWNDLFIAAEEL